MHTEKYRLKVKNTIFTVPKNNIRLLAYTKMRDSNKFAPLDTDQQAIEYLESIGIEVE